MRSLFSLNQVATLAYLGGPIGAGVGLAVNSHRLGREDHTRLFLLLAIVFTIVLHVSNALLPSDLPVAVIPAVYVAAFYALARFVQGGPLAIHEGQGGRHVSWWRVIALSLSCLTASLVLLGGLAFLVPLRASNELAFRNDSVLYEADATRENAIALIEFLEKENVSPSEAGRVFTLIRDAKASKVELRISGDAIPPAETPEFQALHDGVRAFRQTLQREVFRGATVSVVLESHWGIELLRVPPR